VLCDLWNGAQETGTLPSSNTDRPSGTQPVGRKMILQRVTFLMLLVGMGIGGCGPDHSEEVAALQKQVAALTHQVEDMRKQVDAAQEGQQKLRELIGTLEVDVSHLKAREPSQSALTTPAGKGLSTPTTSASVQAREGTAKVSCVQVWKLLGQGTDEATMARTLGTSEAVVQACEQQIGRGKR